MTFPAAMIKLQKITPDNISDVMDLKLTKEQEEYMFLPVQGLAVLYADIGYVEKPSIPFAICNGNEVVGFVMMEFDGEDEFLREKFGDKTSYHIYGLMIDEKHQGKGFAKAAMLKVIEFLRTSPQGEADSLNLSYLPENEAARRLYTSLGFSETGHVLENGERLARLKI
jgi:diamine N-acetyltransferase